MGLDPSIFFQGAALQQANNRDLQNTLSGVAQQYQAQKQKQIDLEKAKETDYEGSVYRVLMANELGQAPDPADVARAKAWDKLNVTQNAIDPVTGNVFSKNRSVFDTLAATQSRPEFASQPSPMGYSGGDAGVVDVSGFGQMPAITEGQLSAPYPKQENVPLPPRGGGFDFGAMAVPQAQPSVDLPMPSNPKQAQDYYKAKLDVTGKALEKDMEIQAERQKLKPKAAAGLLEFEAKNKIINETIDQALKQTTGAAAGFASSTKEIGGTPAANLAALLETIQADAAFAELQKIRDNSPTGGALGGVSEKELGLLQNAAAALSQAQSPAQLKQQLKRYKQIRADSLGRVKSAYEKQYGEMPDFEQDGRLSTPSGVKYRVIE